MKLNLRSVDLNLLPVFVAVVEAGQLSRAADRLGMSQPAVSAALQRLRVTVGDPLFSRTRAGLVPTPRARELHEQVRAGLDQLTLALDPDRAFDPATAERTFRLLAVDYFETLMLGPLMARLREFGPGLGVQVRPPLAGWQRLLLDGEADFAFDTQAPEDPRLAVRVVASETLAVVARAGHPAIRGRLELAAFLEAEHVVLPATERHTLPLEQILGRPDWRRRVGAQVVHYSNLLSVASASDLIATVPLRLAQRLGGGLKLQVLPFPVAVPPIPIYLIWPRVLESDRAHGWFCEQLLACLPTDDR